MTSPAPPKVTGTAKRAPVKPMSTAARRRNYLRQRGGKRIHALGSEGGLTGSQRRRLRHKMGHLKQAAKRRRAVKEQS
jgi:hypothetical protein